MYPKSSAWDMMLQQYLGRCPVGQWWRWCVHFSFSSDLSKFQWLGLLSNILFCGCRFKLALSIRRRFELRDLVIVRRVLATGQMWRGEGKKITKRRILEQKKKKKLACLQGVEKWYLQRVITEVAVGLPKDVGWLSLRNHVWKSSGGGCRAYRGRENRSSQSCSRPSGIVVKSTGFLFNLT